MIHYEVAVPAPDTHLLHVTVRVPAPDAITELSIPAWTPGSYLIREFSRFLGEVSARAEGVTLPCAKTAKGTWRVEAGAARVLELRYTVYAHELTVRTPHVDGGHAFFTGTNALVYVHGRLDEPCALQVTCPEEWTVFCALDPHPEGGWVAPRYDVLADAPVECGPHLAWSFDVLGVPHRCVFWGAERVSIDAAKLQRDLAAIVETNARTFDPDGAALPYARYDFIVHITPAGRGGLEHLNATVLSVPWSAFETDSGARDLLQLAAHEHLHVWNVKRIRPTPLGPFDYQREADTSGLWLSEGWTSYFDTLNCARARVVGQADLLAWLSKDVEKYERTPGRFAQALRVAARDAWIRLYRPDEDTPNRTISYYLKGSLVALCLDGWLIQRGARLDDVMRALWRQFRETGGGFEVDDLGAIVAGACGVAASDVHALLRAWVEDVVPLPIDETLASLGLVAQRKPAGTAWLGVEWDAQPGGLVVKHVFSDGPAHAGPVYPGDLIVALDGRRAASPHVGAHVERLRAGVPVAVTLFRRDVLHTAALTPSALGPGELKIELDPAAPADAVARRETWLGPLHAV